jgi:hypothetical protein
MLPKFIRRIQAFRRPPLSGILHRQHHGEWQLRTIATGMRFKRLILKYFQVDLTYQTGLELKEES